MKYIKIKNQGEIEPQALYLIGASTKKDDCIKIGQFGSGNKYALAYFLRNNYDIHIFAGTKEITITTEKETFRGQDFDVVYIDGVKSSITTEMGKDWKFWQSLREVYCNAIDEGNHSMEFVNEIIPVEGETHFYIQRQTDGSQFFANFDNYFAENKKVLFECKEGKILEKTGKTANIYRRGIKCFETELVSVYDYDFSDIEIEENRLVKFRWQVEEQIWRLVFQCTDKEIIMNILHNLNNDTNIEGQIATYSTLYTNLIGPVFKECMEESRFAPDSFSGLLKPDEVHNHIIIPTKIFKSVRGALTDSQVGDSFKTTHAGSTFRVIEENGLLDKTVLSAIEFLMSVDYPIDYPIKIAIYENDNTCGHAQNGTIYISDKNILKGVQEVANTIIEENIHLKYNVKDATRAFQTAVIDEFINYMKVKSNIIV